MLDRVFGESRNFGQGSTITSPSKDCRFGTESIYFLYCAFLISAGDIFRCNITFHKSYVPFSTRLFRTNVAVHQSAVSARSSGLNTSFPLRLECHQISVWSRPQRRGSRSWRSVCGGRGHDPLPKGRYSVLGIASMLSSGTKRQQPNTEAVGPQDLGSVWITGTDTMRIRSVSGGYFQGRHGASSRPSKLRERRR